MVMFNYYYMTQPVRAFYLRFNFIVCFCFHFRLFIKIKLSIFVWVFKFFFVACREKTSSVEFSCSLGQMWLCLFPAFASNIQKEDPFSPFQFSVPQFYYIVLSFQSIWKYEIMGFCDDGQRGKYIYKVNW